MGLIFQDSTTNGPELSLECEFPHLATISCELTDVISSYKPRQITSNLDELYENAAACSLEFRNIILKVAHKTSSIPEFRNGLKKRTRSNQKINAELERKADYLFDIVAGRISFDTISELYLALQLLGQKSKIVTFRDRFLLPQKSGYRDILINVQLSNGHIAEIQLHLNHLNAVSDQEHAYYQERRSIEAKSQLENRKLTYQEKDRIQYLNEITQSMYNKAWQNALYLSLLYPLTIH